jgi:hypothetical protein
MPRKTLALISGLVLVTVVLFVIALGIGRGPKQLTQDPGPSVPVVEPTSVAHSVLALSPNPITVRPGQSGSVDVTIDTSDNAVTAVQLELAYDPTVISNVKVTSGPLFAQPVVLINKNNAKAGRYTYAFGIQPNQATIQGTGSVATVTFTALKSALGQQSQLALLPETLVTARGVANSVLKSNTGTLIIVSNDAATTSTTKPAVPVDQ